MHAYVVVFLTVLRKLDKGFAEKNREKLRLKGSSWTAGFPIRNQIQSSSKNSTSAKSLNLPDAFLFVTKSVFDIIDIDTSSVDSTSRLA